MLSFKHTKPDKDFIESIFAFDVRKLEQTDSLKISQFVIALSQYSIYFKSKQNETKAEIVKKQRFIDATVIQLITKDVLKEYTTKTAASTYIIENTEVLYKAKKVIEGFKDELILLEGVDKSISEYIAAFKRELTRRENELWQTKKER